MKKLAFLGFLLALSFNANADCQKVVTLELSQSHFTLDLWEHAKDAMNKQEVKLPFSCEFADSLKVGDDLMKDGFRVGSFIVHGSFGDWHLKVKSK